MIKKIKHIKDFAVFNDFDWDKSVRDKGHNIAEFKKLNIIYGRNYSGKTTLSRIFRSFEKRHLHEKYPDSIFELSHAGNELLNQGNLNTNAYHIRVYNRDFVKDNLEWLIDEEDGSIKPFAIMGDKNIEIEKDIKKKNEILGNEDEKNGLRYDLKIKKEAYEKKKEEKAKRQNDLDEKLRRKANDEIKPNSIYNDINYNISNIKEDIKTLKEKPQQALSEDEIESKKKLLTEKAKENIPLLSVYSPNFNYLYETTKEILSKEIKPTKSIQELLNDAVLQEWVRHGIPHHRDKRETCAFCSSKLPDDLWEKLDAHFSKESEELRKTIEEHLSYIQQEKDCIKDLLKLKENQFYYTLCEQFVVKETEWDAAIKQYCSNLDKLTGELKARDNDIFKTRRLDENDDNSKTIEDIQEDFNKIITKNNEKTKTLKDDQGSARNDLRLNEVSRFIKNVSYDNDLININKLTDEEGKLKEEKEEIEKQIKTIESKIENLLTQLKDERKGVEKINEYLNHFFAHKELRLASEENNFGSKFVIKREDKLAYNLSEGECSLIAFCYFMAKLEDAETKDKELIIWIDDPVSSLDSNHIFFVFSLIESVITKPNKNADNANVYKYKQLFVSTHNLDFLKYLKCLSRPKNNTGFFIIESSCKKSNLQLMPEHFKNYTTEFNYLFHQIYKCSSKISYQEPEYYYNFGNNLRKFLEAYLYYKYPDNKRTEEKVTLFFGNDRTSAILTNRIYNELSHLEENFDRSMKPIEIPEIKKLADYVINKIKEKEPDQYKALLNSIGKIEGTING